MLTDGSVKINWFSFFKERKNMKDGALTTFEDCDVTREGEQMRAGDLKKEMPNLKTTEFKERSVTCTSEI